MVAAHPEVRRVVVFGSLARGEAVPGSDVDLLAVLSRSDEPFLARIGRYVPSAFPVGVEIFPYTEDEVRKMLVEGHSFLRRALAEGVELYRRGSDVASGEGELGPA
jgi:predicted nucleotidyltransferase